MTAFYYITKYITFPGAYVKCFWEQIICRICKVPVEDNRYLRKDELAGHVDHELMPTARAAFAFCFVPAFLNAIGALFLAIFPVVFLFIYGTTNTLLTIVCAVSYWLAVSLFVNSYSLVEDAMNMKEKVYKEGNILQKIFYSPAFVFLYIGSHLESYGITFIAAVITTVAMVVAL